MIDQQLQKFTATADITVVNAMSKIDSNAQGILFVVDGGGRLVGCITDGDIRRWVIKTGDLSATADRYMNRDPRFLPLESRKEALAYMRAHSIRSIPLVDAGKRIADVIFADDFSAPQQRRNEGLKNTPVVIMAGGMGTRLYPYTKILPKPLIPIGEVPILERIINRFCEYGVSRFYLTLNYKKGMIKSYFADLAPEYEVCYVEEDKPLGTAGSIRLIKDSFDSPVIVTNCDTLIDADYAGLMEHHISSGNVLTVVSALKDIVIPYGVIQTGERGSIVSIEEKPKTSYFINTGFYVLNPELIKMIPDDTVFHMPDLAEQLIREGYPVGIYPIGEDAFLDMGEFEEMRRMEKKLNLE